MRLEKTKWEKMAVKVFDKFPTTHRDYLLILGSRTVHTLLKSGFSAFQLHFQCIPAS